MKKLCSLSIMIMLTTIGCQFEAPIPTVVPDITARAAREILFSGSDGTTEIGEKIYQYNAEGYLTEVKHYTKNGAGLLNTYELYEYDSRNRVVQRRLYHRQNQSTSNADFILYQEQRFQYLAENNIVSQNYYFTSGKHWLQKWTETRTENGRPIRATSYNPNNDGASRGLLFEDITYVYEGDRLAKEEYRNAKQELYQTNERHYKGRTAEVVIIYPGQSKFIIQVLDYDRRGRLIKQQFRNPNTIGSQLQTVVAPVFPPISVFEYND